MGKTAVLFINIGSPSSPKVSDVQSYLNEFLMDPYVINVPYIIRHLLIKKLIVPKRAPQSAKSYQKIWKKEGSPLVVYTDQLIQKINSQDPKRDWFFSMRYSEPRIEKVLDQIKKSGYDQLIVFPAFPQWASSTTQSSCEYVKKTLKDLHWNPKTQYIQEFYNHPQFIQNITKNIPSNTNLNDFEHILFSFHGLPVSHIKKISPKCQFSQCCHPITKENSKCYRAQCYQTAHLIAQELNIPPYKWSLSFQSRLGPLKWIPPYTKDHVKSLVLEKGLKKIAVFSPSFVTDCLETLEELDIQLKNFFLELGGEKWVRIPCLNDQFTCVLDIV